MKKTLHRILCAAAIAAFAAAGAHDGKTARLAGFRFQRNAAAREPLEKGGHVALEGDAGGHHAEALQHRVRVYRTVRDGRREEAFHRHTGLPQ